LRVLRPLPCRHNAGLDHLHQLLEARTLDGNNDGYGPEIGRLFQAAHRAKDAVEPGQVVFALELRGAKGHKHLMVTVERSSSNETIVVACGAVLSMSLRLADVLVEPFGRSWRLRAPRIGQVEAAQMEQRAWVVEQRGRLLDQGRHLCSGRVPRPGFRVN